MPRRALSDRASAAFPGNPAKKGNIASLLKRRPMQLGRKAVLDGRRKLALGNFLCWSLEMENNGIATKRE